MKKSGGQWTCLEFHGIKAACTQKVRSWKRKLTSHDSQKVAKKLRSTLVIPVQYTSKAIGIKRRVVGKTEYLLV